MTRTARLGIMAMALAGWMLPAIAMGDAPEDMQGSKGQLSAEVTAGRSVVFTGHGGGASWFGGVWLHFGDGENVMFCRPGSGCRETSQTHTYARGGTYKAELVGSGEGSGTTLATATVTVSD